MVRNSFKRLGRTFLELTKQKHIFVFLLAFFFYIDGVYTVIDMATAYGQALGLDSTGASAGASGDADCGLPVRALFQRTCEEGVGRRRSSRYVLRHISVSRSTRTGWITQLDFWILAVLVGMFQGTIQALSRSYFAKIIPAEKSGEFFGIYDICGKGASVVGTALVSVMSQLTEGTNIGVSALSVMFLIGFVLFRYSAKLNAGRKGR